MTYPHPDRLMRENFWLRVRSAILTALVLVAVNNNLTVEVVVDPKKKT